MIYRDDGKENGHYGFTVEGSGFRDITPIMESQMEKEMETLGQFEAAYRGL